MAPCTMHLKNSGLSDQFAWPSLQNACAIHLEMQVSQGAIVPCVCVLVWYLYSHYFFTFSFKSIAAEDPLHMDLH